jgi:cell division protein FtsB
MRKIIFLVIILLFISLDASLFKGSFEDYKKLKEISVNDIKLSDLEKENERLKKTLATKDLPFTIEKEARDKLGFARDGESIIVVPGNDLSLGKNQVGQKQKTSREKWLELLTN